MANKKTSTNTKKIRNTDYDRWSMNGGGIKPIKSNKDSTPRKKK